MKDGCLRPEEIVLAIEASDEDPRHRHLNQCSRCQALAASLDLFRRDGELPAGADLQDAEDRLGDFLQQEIVGEGETEPVVLLPTERSRRRRNSPIWWAAAAVLVVAISLPVFLDRDKEQRRDIVLRSEDVSDETGLQLTAPRWTSEGELLLEWSELESATSYDVVLLDGNQLEVGLIDAGEQATSVISARGLGVLASRPRPWFAVIVAWDESGEMARSLPRMIPES